MRAAVSLNVNGRDHELEVDPRATLLEVLRNEVGLTGTKAGCDDSECGACMVLLDGQPLNSCSYLAVQTDGREILTVEGLATDDGLSGLQRAILEDGGVQCGFCTPGMLVSGAALQRRGGIVTEDDVRVALAGNLCRCTGYTKIVSAFTRVLNEQLTKPTEGRRADERQRTRDLRGRADPARTGR